MAETILCYLDANSLYAAEQVCREWFRVIQEGHIWRRLIQRNIKNNSFRCETSRIKV